MCDKFISNLSFVSEKNKLLDDIPVCWAKLSKKNNIVPAVKRLLWGFFATAGVFVGAQ